MKDDLYFALGYQTREEFIRNQLFNVVAVSLPMAKELGVSVGSGSSSISGAVRFMKRLTNYTLGVLERLSDRNRSRSMLDAFGRGGGRAGGTNMAGPPSGVK